MPSLDLVVLSSGSQKSHVVFARCEGDSCVAELPNDGQLACFETFRNRIEQALQGKPDRPTEKELHSFGKSIFSYLFNGDTLKLYNRLGSLDHLRLQIITNSPTLQLVPWEYIQEPGSNSGPRLERSVVRIVPTIGIDPMGPISGDKKLRVLLVLASPGDQRSLSYTEVRNAIRKSFESRMPSEKFELHVLDNPDFASLRNALMSHGKGYYQILHFVGHGNISNGQGYLSFTDPRTENSEEVSAEKLATVLRPRGISLVFLSACDTSTGNFSEPFAVTAEALIRSGIPSVVANQAKFPDKTLALFAGAFYQGLQTWGDCDRAISEGRIALASALGSSGQTVLEWGVPTLYRHIAFAEFLIPNEE